MRGGFVRLLIRKIEKTGQAWALYCPQDLAAQGPKVLKEARLVGRKVALFWLPATGRGEEVCPKTGSLPPGQWGGKRFYIDRGRVACRNRWSAPKVIFRLVVGGLISIIFVALGPVHFQFQGQFVSIFEANSQNCSSFCRSSILLAMQLSSPAGGVSVSVRQLTGHGSEYTCSLWGGTKRPRLRFMTTLSSFGHLWLFSFVFVHSYTFLWSNLFFG